MKATICKSIGEVEDLKLEDVDIPEMRDNQVRIGIKAAALNFPDILTVQGKYQHRPSLPFSPGMECSGEILEIGREVVGSFKTGDRVMANPGVGCLAEQVCTAPEKVYSIPDNVSYEAAAGFIVTYGTVYHAFVDRGHLRPGETLLVLGAAGGVGLCAVELGKLLGAQVIAAASNETKLELCQQYGADHLLNYSKSPIKESILELTDNKGIDVVFDPVGGDATFQSLRCMNREGRLLIIGFAGGSIADIPANRLLLRQCQAVGVAFGSYGAQFPAEIRANMNILTDWWKHGMLKPHVSMTFPLEQSIDAMKALTTRKATGKVVVTLD